MTNVERLHPDCHLHTPHVPVVNGLVATTWELCRYYKRRSRLLSLLFLDFVVSYVGGAFFFWVHAIVRGERGPQIAHWQHWLLDSSIAFVGLLPPLAVLLPLSHVGAERIRRHVPVVHVTALRTACLAVPFACVTAAGPIAHDLLAGEGTALANAVTRWFGATADTAAHASAAAVAPESAGHLTDMGVQLALGVPVYTLLLAGSFVVVCRLTCRRDDDPRVIDLRAAEAREHASRR